MFNSKTFSLLIAIAFLFTSTINAQVQKINLGQTPGEFTIKSLSLSPGEYQFEIANNGVDREVGFVLAPKGKTDQASHIKEAYVKAPVKNGTSSLTSVVKLSAGEYVYFCPLNPTDQYQLTVEAPYKKISLEQVKGAFTTEKLALEAGDYEFEIVNNGVDHEVGFVVAPKGKTDPANHIKAAYVKSPVKNGTSSTTNVVTLTPGNYVYFCPLNPTKEYELVVK